MTVSSKAEHYAIEGKWYLGQAPYNPLGRLWYGTPVWPKAAFVSISGRFANQYWNDAETESGDEE